MNFLEEQARRLALRDEEARQGAKKFEKENKVRVKQKKLLTRWSPGTIVMDKRLKQQYIYCGNVFEDGKEVYLLEARDSWGRNIRFSRPPDKAIVKLNRGPV